MKRIVLAAVSICLTIVVVLLLMSYWERRKQDGISDPQDPYPRKKQIQYSFTLQNESDRLLERAELWAYGPVKQTATQRCDRIEASHPYDLAVDGLGNQVLHFVFKDLPPYGARIVTIGVELSVSDLPNRLPHGGLEDAVRPERYIESGDPRVAHLAGSIQGDQAVDRPRALFRWVSENIRDAGYSREERGALDCLMRRAGDCTEQMYLLIALCRAAGIPARGVGGYVCDADCVFKPSDYHNWAEFHEDGAWQLADPQKGVFKESPSRYIATRILAASDHQAENPMGAFHRFRFEGDGLKVRMSL